jgi:hypothetical protein
MGGSEVYNIYPYAKDGTPLREVRLFDQDGRPIILDPEMNGYVIDQRCLDGPPPRNEYPLPLRRGSKFAALDLKEGQPVVPTPEPTPCVTPTPDPTPTETPAPAEASPTPTPSAR